MLMIRIQLDPYQQPYNCNNFGLIVERPPEAKEQVHHLLHQAEQGQHYPIGHPVHILLKGEGFSNTHNFTFDKYSIILIFTKIKYGIHRAESNGR